jgi:hypothetical protein
MKSWNLEDEDDDDEEGEQAGDDTQDVSVIFLYNYSR